MGLLKQRFSTAFYSGQPEPRADIRSSNMHHHDLSHDSNAPHMSTTSPRKGERHPKSTILRRLIKADPNARTGTGQKTEPRPNALRLYASLLALHSTRLPGGPDTHFGRIQWPVSARRPQERTTPHKARIDTHSPGPPCLLIGRHFAPDLAVDLEPFSRGLGCFCFIHSVRLGISPHIQLHHCDDTLPRAIPPP